MTDEHWLVVKHDPMVLSLATKLARRIHSIDIEDLIQAGRVGLCEAAKKWDPNQASFGTFASLRISGSMKDFLRNSAQVKMRATVDGKKVYYFGKTTSVRALDRKGVEPKLGGDLGKLLFRLSSRERMILTAWANDVPRAQTAKALKISVNYVDLIRKRSILKLREMTHAGSRS